MVQALLTPMNDPAAYQGIVMHGRRLRFRSAIIRWFITVARAKNYELIVCKWCELVELLLAMHAIMSY